MYDKSFREMVCNEYMQTEITRKAICEKYQIKVETLKSWLRRFYPDRFKNDPNARKYNGPVVNPKQVPLLNNSDYKEMTKEEMQIELIKKDFEIERLKKKYQVMKDPITGEKQFVSFKDLNMK